MTRLTLCEGLLEETLAILHACGDERQECVALWTGPVRDLGAVDEVVHPVHTSRHGGYQIDRAWWHELCLDLADSGRSIRAQVHTHPLDAFHSHTDDEFAVCQHSGFLSIVVPRFARPPVASADIFAARIDTDGAWRALPFEEAVSWH